MRKPLLYFAALIGSLTFAGNAAAFHGHFCHSHCCPPLVAVPVVPAAGGQMTTGGSFGALPVFGGFGSFPAFGPAPAFGNFYYYGSGGINGGSSNNSNGNNLGPGFGGTGEFGALGDGTALRILIQLGRLLGQSNLGGQIGNILQPNNGGGLTDLSWKMSVETRLAEHEAAILRLHKDMGEIKKTQKDHSDKLDQILEQVKKIK